MSKKLRFSIVIGAAIGFAVIGYSSAAVSLPTCDDHIADWLSDEFPHGPCVERPFMNRSGLLLPFVAKSQAEKDWRPAESEDGPWYTATATRYYFTFFGLVIPIWTSLNAGDVVA